MDGNETETELASIVESMSSNPPAIRGDLPRLSGNLAVFRADRRGRHGTPDVLVSIAAGITSSYMATHSILVTIIVATCVLATALVRD